MKICFGSDIGCRETDVLEHLKTAESVTDCPDGGDAGLKEFHFRFSAPVAGSLIWVAVCISSSCWGKR